MIDFKMISSLFLHGHVTQNLTSNAWLNSGVGPCSTKVGSKEPGAAPGHFEPTYVCIRLIPELSEAFESEFCVTCQLPKSAQNGGDHLEVDQVLKS